MDPSGLSSFARGIHPFFQITWMPVCCWTTQGCPQCCLLFEDSFLDYLTGHPYFGFPCLVRDKPNMRDRVANVDRDTDGGGFAADPLLGAFKTKAKASQPELRVL